MSKEDMGASCGPGSRASHGAPVDRHPPGFDPSRLRESLLSHAGNLSRYPFTSATMAEAGKLAADAIRNAVWQHFPDVGAAPPERTILAGEEYVRADLVVHQVAGGVRRDVHRDTPVPVHVAETCTSCTDDPHEVFYIRFADDGTALRKWSRTPFEGARMCRVALPASVIEARSGETHSGSTEGESAAPTGETP